MPVLEAGQKNTHPVISTPPADKEPGNFKGSPAPEMPEK